MRSLGKQDGRFARDKKAMGTKAVPKIILLLILALKHHENRRLTPMKNSRWALCSDVVKMLNTVIVEREWVEDVTFEGLRGETTEIQMQVQVQSRLILRKRVVIS